MRSVRRQTSSARRWRRCPQGCSAPHPVLKLAALALLAWSRLGPGLWRSLLYTAVVTTGVSTPLFNLNPLLRLDGHHILADLLGLPNLRRRADACLLDLVKRRLLGARTEAPEGVWMARLGLSVFGLASLVYRGAVMVAAIVLVAGQHFFFGALLALWALAVWLAIPLAAALKQLLAGAELRRARRRTVSSSACSPRRAGRSRRASRFSFSMIRKEDSACVSSRRRSRRCACVAMRPGA